MAKVWLAVVVGLLAAGAVAQPSAGLLRSATADASDLASSASVLEGEGMERVALSIPSQGRSQGSGSAPVPVPNTIDAAAARSAIEAANESWLSAFRSGDSTQLARIYAPDASLFPPTNSSLEGRERIVEYFGAQRRAGMGDASLKTLDVVCVGDIAYEVGTYRFRFGGPEGESDDDSGRYFTIWKSQADGSWRYQVGIWSSNRDVTATASR